MDKIQDYNQIKSLINKIKSYKEGYITNFYLGEERCNDLIKGNLLYYVNYDKCIFILSKDFDFYHLSFIVTDITQLTLSLKKIVNEYPELLFVSDIIGFAANVSNFTELFEEAGFQKYKKLVRLANLDAYCSEDQVMQLTSYASYEQSLQIKELLENYFDRYSEQLPLMEEINHWIEKKQILVIKDGKQILGFIIFDINGLTASIRYWFVHPDFRNRKLGSGLIKSFFCACKHTKRKLLWVMEDNENAIVRYKHYGFHSDSMIDQILIKTF